MRAAQLVGEVVEARAPLLERPVRHRLRVDEDLRRLDVTAGAGEERIERVDRALADLVGRLVHQLAGEARVQQQREHAVLLHATLVVLQVGDIVDAARQAVREQRQDIFANDRPQLRGAGRHAEVHLDVAAHARRRDRLPLRVAERGRELDAADLAHRRRDHRHPARHLDVAAVLQQHPQLDAGGILLDGGDASAGDDLARVEARGERRGEVGVAAGDVVVHLAEAVRRVEEEPHLVDAVEGRDLVPLDRHLGLDGDADPLAHLVRQRVRGDEILEAHLGERDQLGRQRLALEMAGVQLLVELPRLVVPAQPGGALVLVEDAAQVGVAVALALIGVNLAVDPHRRMGDVLDQRQLQLL